MPEPISFGELDFNLVTSMSDTRHRPEKERPFHLLVMGDFSGRANQTRNPSGTSLPFPRPIKVDRDNFDMVLAKLGVTIFLPILGENATPVQISFSELDDFHPDSLYRRLDVFQALKDMRKNLGDPSTMAALVREWQKESPPEKTIPQPSFEPTSGNLLDLIIEQQPAPQKTSTQPPTNWDSFLNEIVSPHLVPKAHPRHAEMLDAVDAATSELMQMILHHKEFQALEAAWQGLFFLVSRLETNSQLTLSLLDVTKEELLTGRTKADDLRSTALYKIWVEQTVGTAGGEPWAVITGNYTFEKQHNDLKLLGRMAKIAKAAGTCFITAAGDRFVCQQSIVQTPDPDDWQPDENPEDEETWQKLRHIPEAAHIGLALPRILLRLPYGRDTDEIDTFNFEEMQVSPVHEKYLWGNPSFAILLLLGQTFSRYGWQMQPGQVLDIDSLPLHVYRENGESRLKPCAEACLSQQAAEQMMSRGLMPLLSFMHQDKARLGRFQSIADPLSRLAGPWR